MAEIPKRDWKKLVEESNGRSLFCPDKLIDQTKVWLEKRAELNREVDRISKIEIETKMLLENLVFEVRKYLEETGGEQVWTSEVGFDSEALKENIYIISVDKK